MGNETSMDALVGSTKTEPEGMREAAVSAPLMSWSRTGTEGEVYWMPLTEKLPFCVRTR